MTEKKTFIENYIIDLQRMLGKLDLESINRAIMWLREIRDNDKMVFICGNGGSASIASQMVVDIIKGASYGRKRRFRMIGLTDSIATVTAYANDVSYDRVFVEQLVNYAEPGNMLVAISGSGNSANVLEAVAYANEAGFRTIGLTTGEGGQLKDIAQLPILVPSHHMGRLEDCFFIITHILCYAFMDDNLF